MLAAAASDSLRLQALALAPVMALLLLLLQSSAVGHRSPSGHADIRVADADSRQILGTQACDSSDSADINQFGLRCTDLAPDIDSLLAAPPSLGTSGWSLGRDPSLVLRASELDAAGWSLSAYLGATRRLLLAAESLLNERHRPARCRRITRVERATEPTLYSNEYFLKPNSSGLGKRHLPADIAAYPGPQSQSWHPPRGFRECAPPECSAAGWHRDGGSENRITLWLPVLSEAAITQWPLVFANTSTLVGRVASAGGDMESHAQCFDLPQGREAVRAYSPHCIG
jgi:hypothetical protein